MIPMNSKLNSKCILHPIVSRLNILLDATEDWEFTTHEHNLNDWIDAWNRENTGSFPNFFQAIRFRIIKT